MFYSYQGKNYNPSEKNMKKSLANSLKNAVWGIVTDPNQQAAQKQFFKDRMAEIVNNIFTQGVVEVRVAIQTLILFINPQEKYIHYGNAKRMVTSNANLLNEAFEDIYAALPANRMVFIKTLRALTHGFKDDNHVCKIINEFCTKKESFLTLMKKINQQLKVDLPYVHCFEENTLTVNAFNKTYTFNIQEGFVATAFRKAFIFHITQGDLQLITQFISLRIFAFISADIYNKVYHDLLLLSFEQFCDPTKPSADKNYQSAVLLLKNNLQKASLTAPEITHVVASSAQSQSSTQDSMDESQTSSNQLSVQESTDESQTSSSQLSVQESTGESQTSLEINSVSSTDSLLCFQFPSLAQLLQPCAIEEKQLNINAIKKGSFSFFSKPF